MPRRWPPRGGGSEGGCVRRAEFWRAGLGDQGPLDDEDKIHFKMIGRS